MAEQVHASLHPHITPSGAGADLHVGNHSTSADVSGSVGNNHTHTEQVQVNHNFGHGISGGASYTHMAGPSGSQNHNQVHVNYNGNGWSGGAYVGDHGSWGIQATIPLF